MTFDLDDEILQDFLVEAAEILEQLGEQLVDLERAPQDTALLNAIFRGFHTVKGGAGFLNITALVEICHVAEDVFNVLRQGQWSLDADLMDVVLQAFDAVTAMINEVREGRLPEPADPGMVETLRGYTGLAAVQAEPVQVARPEPGETGAAGEDEIVAGELGVLLDKLSRDKADGGPVDSDAPVRAESSRVTAAAAAPTSDDEHITDEEFEALLDELHGSGGAPTGASRVSAVPSSGPAAASPRSALAPAPGAGKSAAETSIRVDTQRLDEIMNMVGELVLVRNRLATLKSNLVDEELANAVANLDVVTSDLQLSVMKTRMQPVKKVFGRFPRVVRDLARNLEKEVDLELIGEETDLDKNLVEALADPLVHLVRNAVDHGIEPPEERERSGKPRRGRVVLSAEQEGDHILLSVEDDGKGMDPDVLRRKAVEKGMMEEETAARLDERECCNLIFHPGFSTSAQVSDVSGRGVGMDVVKTRIAQMNGTVEIESKLGAGSKIIVKLPLTLAILPTLMVILGDQPFALPLSSVVEIFNLDLERTNTVDGQLTIRVRDRALPLFYLRQWLVRQGGRRDDARGHVVVVNVGGVQVGLVVDYLVGQEEVVIKPLGALLRGMEGMAGATITGDGKIALILDVPGLIRRYARR